MGTEIDVKQTKLGGFAVTFIAKYRPGDIVIVKTEIERGWFRVGGVRFTATFDENAFGPTLPEIEYALVDFVNGDEEATYGIYHEDDLLRVEDELAGELDALRESLTSPMDDYDREQLEAKISILAEMLDIYIEFGVE